MASEKMRCGGCGHSRVTLCERAHVVSECLVRLWLRWLRRGGAK